MDEQTKNGLINFGMLKMIGRVMRGYKSSQKKPYSLVPVPYFQENLQKEWEKAEAIPENDLWDMSTRVEPKQK